MPLIQVKIIEGVFTPAQKQDIVRKLTDAMVAIEGENMRPVTWCVVEEVKSGDWGIAGEPLADFAHRERADRSIVNAPIGHRERSAATLA
jgi:4-oxalocrotonate tautomerase